MCDTNVCMNKVISKPHNNHEATIPSNYDNVEDIAQEATTLHNAVEVSLSQEEMQKKDTESTCKTFRKFNTY